MRDFISACSGTITVLGALCLMFGALSFLIGLSSSGDGAGLAGSFVALVFVGSGLSTVLLGGTTFMLCSIDSRLEAQFGLTNKSEAGSEMGSAIDAQLAAQIFAKAEGEVKVQSAMVLPLENLTVSAGWYVEQVGSTPFYFPGGTITNEVRAFEILNIKLMPDIGEKADSGFYKLRDDRIVWHSGGAVNLYSLPAIAG